MPSGGREAECSRNSARNWCSRRCGVCGRGCLDYVLSYQILSPNPSTISPGVFPSLLGGHSSTSASAVMYDACPRQHSHSLPSQVCLRLYETTSSVTNCSEQVAQLDGAI